MLAVEWSNGIEDAFSNIVTFVPKLIGFALILIIGYFVAKAISKLVNSLLERVGFDNAVEKGGVKKALEKSQFDASDILAKIVFYAIFLFVLQLAFSTFGTGNPISQLITSVIAYLPKLFVAILILVVASAIAAAVKELVSTALGGLSYGNALGVAASVAILVIGVFAALNQLQIAPTIVNTLFTALVAIVAGSAIIAIGGGGIAPMRSQWEKALNKAQEEGPKVKQQSQGAGDRIKERAQEVRQQASSGGDTDATRVSGSRTISQSQT